MKGIRHLFFALVIVFFAYLIIGESLLPHDAIDGRDACYEYEGDWTYTDNDGNTSAINIPTKKTVDIKYLETVVTGQTDMKSYYMCFRGKEFRAYIDGQEIYDYNTDDTRLFGSSSPECYVMIPLSKADEGKTLRIEMSPLTSILYKPFVGSELGIWMHLLRTYFGEMAIAVLTIIMGMLTVIVSKIFGIVSRKHLEITYLGFGILLSAVWIVANSVFRQIIFPNVSVASDLPFLMVMIIPFPFMIYLNIIQEGRYNRVYKIACGVLGVVDISCVLLYVLGIKELVSSFIFVAGSCVLEISVLIVTFIIDMVNGKIKKYKYVAVGLLCAFIAAIVQIVIYFNRTGIFSGAFLAVGLLVLLVCASIHTVKSIFSIEKEKTAAIMANEAKGKFLAKMSHEIRTPINAVLGMNEMILRETKEINTREYALDIMNAGKSLLSLINDILDISKIESGKVEIIPVDYDVSSMINDTVNMISHKAKTKELEVWLDVDEELPSRLLGDDVRIRQVMINILNNAVKYTNEGGVTLSVRGKKYNDKFILKVAIKDTGVGIKEEDIPKLYEEFRRIDEKNNRNVEGTGLGMSITVQLLSLMGSHLDVSSKYGEGSCFFFELEQGIVDDSPIGNLSERIRSQDEDYDYETSFTAAEAEVLIVDDNAVNRKVLRNLLKGTQLRMDEADSGEECLEKIEEKKYDLIFLDHMMPGMDGIETLKEIRSREENPNSKIPVVALTANAVTGAKEMYLANGFDAFLSKPIVYVKLENTLLSLLPEDKVKKGSLATKKVDTAEEDEDISSKLEELPEINLEYAYMLNGGPQSLYEVIVDYYKMIDSEADKLEYYMDNIDIDDNLKQFRVKVHAMKASAAMIGAMHISGMARMLEKLAIEENTEAIMNIAPVFLGEWRSFKEKLSPLMPEESLEADELADFNRNLIEEQLELLIRAMEEFDVDRADELVLLLKKFKYPDNCKRIMEDIYTAVTNLDEDKVRECVEDFHHQ